MLYLTLYPLWHRAYADTILRVGLNYENPSHSFRQAFVTKWYFCDEASHSSGRRYCR